MAHDEAEVRAIRAEVGSIRGRLAVVEAAIADLIQRTIMTERMLGELVRRPGENPPPFREEKEE
jgi:hypothetical protein